MNKKIIVITSINYPTESVLLFSKMKEYELIVAGDKKTPIDWQCENVCYIPPQENDFELEKNLPYNHYCRKMIGYLKAIQRQADYIIDFDDDTIIKDNWSFPVFESKFDMLDCGNKFVNIYQFYTDKKIWTRGLPLKKISTQIDPNKYLLKRHCKIGIWQGLVDGNPDVDAIYRLTDDSPCYFVERNPIVLNEGVVSPFNSQNTIFRKELFPLLYLPNSTTFRFTDILRGLVAQPIMWVYNYCLGFTNATAIQKRNEHDYMEDFISEIPMYINCEKVIDLVSGSISKTESIEENLFKSYESLMRNNIVSPNELITLSMWLKELQKLKNN